MIACLFAGTAIWAKPQVILLALAVCLVGFLLRRLTDRPSATKDGAWGDMVVVGISFVAPSLFFIGAMIGGGTFSSFLSEPIAFTMDYLFARDRAVGGGAATIIVRVSIIVFFLFVHVLALMWLIPGVTAISARWKKILTRDRLILIAIIAAPLLSAVLTISVLYPLFPHYMNIYYVACMISGIAAITAAHRPLGERTIEQGKTAPRRARRVSRSIFVASIVASLVVVLEVPVVASGLIDLARRPAVGPAATTSVTVSACPPGSRVFVWGWSPDLYAVFDWAPASRFISAMALLPWGHQDAYKATIYHEITTDLPSCIVDATGPDFFAFSDTPAGVYLLPVVIPDLAPVLKACYTATSDVLPPDDKSRARTVTLWTRRNDAVDCADTGARALHDK